MTRCKACDGAHASVAGLCPACAAYHQTILYGSLMAQQRAAEELRLRRDARERREFEAWMTEAWEGS